MNNVGLFDSCFWWPLLLTISIFHIISVTHPHPLMKSVFHSPLHFFVVVQCLMRREANSLCCFHPQELVVGVCAFCLNERLLILASQQPSYLSSSRPPSPPPIPNLRLFRVFRSLHPRLLFRRRNPEHSDHEPSTSHQDAFISMEFERSGIGSWERSERTKDSKENRGQPWKHSTETGRKEAKETKSRRVVEHGKRHASVRWRKRMYQLMRWWKKRPNQSGGAVCHVSAKVGYGF